MEEGEPEATYSCMSSRHCFPLPSSQSVPCHPHNSLGSTWDGSLCCFHSNFASIRPAVCLCKS